MTEHINLIAKEEDDKKVKSYVTVSRHASPIVQAHTDLGP